MPLQTVKLHLYFCKCIAYGNKDFDFGHWGGKLRYQKNSSKMYANTTHFYYKLTRRPTFHSAKKFRWPTNIREQINENKIDGLDCQEFIVWLKLI